MAWTIYIGQLVFRAMIRTIEIGFKLIGLDDHDIGQDDVRAGEQEYEKGGKGKKTGDKVEDHPNVVVLSTDIHCQGCALKFKRRALRHKGVKKAEVDMASNQMTVKGEFTSSELHQHMEAYPHYKFQIVSDQHKPKETSTVGLSVRLDCNGCIQTVNKMKGKVEGVQEVIVDAERNHVTVTGTMDEDSLVKYVRDNLARNVEVVPAKGGKR
ncbi:hypothetical protein KFK09_017705 [Dendrobium nobile]|uniref:HMA domain-containing protein n=1 Tax=Dendrobium nobile TaxID=94219 RepID=A0A8T3ATQ4_DENNO|nr:hypothetical protein KFK09_017705 [Dendrobium nobile]